MLPDVADLSGHWREELSAWLVARMAGERVSPLVMEH